MYWVVLLHYYLVDYLDDYHTQPIFLSLFCALRQLLLCCPANRGTANAVDNLSGSCDKSLIAYDTC